jgi:hypothetical protein
MRDDVKIYEKNLLIGNLQMKICNLLGVQVCTINWLNYLPQSETCFIIQYFISGN